MNPGGPVEEIGSTARSVIHVLESQPLSLAMILTNIALLVFLFYSQNQFYGQRQELSKYFLESEREVREILSRCIVPGRGGSLEPLKPVEPVEEPQKHSEVEVAPLKP